jgi:hypothetical protein
MVMVLVVLTGCNGQFWKDFHKPYSLDLTPPPGPPEYQQGWSDGCESGMLSYSNALAKTFRVFELKQDPRLRENKMYYQVWKDAFLYCSIFIEATRKFGI